MAYIDYAYYKAYNIDSDMEETEFDQLVELSDQVVNSLTKDKIETFGFDAFSDYTKDRIQKATASQLSVIESQGGFNAFLGDSTAVLSSMRTGKYSETKKDGEGIQTINGVPVSPMVSMYLMPTNLLNKAVKCVTIDFFR